ncbi:MULTISPECIES: prepilin-type N-terminal cleavage/methylation domain-containing protein [unclassified Psychrobacter]|uniref:prepilin-type N-terminal cleavage/methylation domain-containing protein n=1 Tax=unclassified Psychrobacter TaxID=196806 RepID=UPI0025B2AAAE|nr:MULTISPECIES: prepilin-type N-terminal cleavage/methylation domain-containing protein [unclassified Psychrobacter]MDN3452350.1 prepilin-type N-terminal cleavage/methylation domain-containing protein [Psychrobacter sp. APC 3350]MDN3502170.1 prepilin-type N-terminal cleavage/methylation domain-containing protein [Psychrobacter sp. 5A.1]
MPVTVQTQSSAAATCPFALIGQTSRPSSLNSLPARHCGSSPLLSTNACHSSSASSINSAAQTGFTLVEIVVVVVILSIFAGMMSLSVGSSESRKNRAFYEHLTDSLSYVRLLSAERMQPMGLRLQADKQGQVAPVIVTLSNPYITYQTNDAPSDSMDSRPKNSMELSADLTSMSGATGAQQPTPSWEVEPEVSLPDLPTGVSIRVQSLDASHLSGTGQGQALQPWFSSQTVPQVLWFGTGQATPVTIEVLHDARLVGEVITIMPDGSMTMGQR